MKVLCPYVPGELNPATRDALQAYAPGTEFVDVSGHMLNYFWAIQERWTGEHDLVVIEQDMIIEADTLLIFNRCPKQWCTFAYRYDRGNVPVLLYSGLGCARFTARLQREVEFSTVAPDSTADPKSVGIPWVLLDYAIQCMLRPLYPHCHDVLEHQQTKRDWEHLEGFPMDPVWLEQRGPVF